LKRQADVEKFVNKKRSKRIWRDNNIETEKWRQHFMNLLNGIEIITQKKEEMEAKDRTGKQENKDLEEEEIKGAKEDKK